MTHELIWNDGQIEHDLITPEMGREKLEKIRDADILEKLVLDGHWTDDHLKMIDVTIDIVDLDHGIPQRSKLKVELGWLGWEELMIVAKAADNELGPGTHKARAAVLAAMQEQTIQAIEDLED